MHDEELMEQVARRLSLDSERLVQTAPGERLRANAPARKEYSRRHWRRSRRRPLRIGDLERGADGDCRPGIVSRRKFGYRAVFLPLTVFRRRRKEILQEEMRERKARMAEGWRPAGGRAF